MDNINVVIRVRPLIKKEESSHWTNDKQHISSRDKNFTFDRIFGPQEDNQRVYDEIGRPIVDQVRYMADWMNMFFIGRNFRDFANYLDVRESLNPLNCALEVEVTCEILIKTTENNHNSHSNQKIAIIMAFAKVLTCRT